MATSQHQIGEKEPLRLLYACIRGGQKKWCTVCEELAPFSLLSSSRVSTQQNTAKQQTQSYLVCTSTHWSLQEAGMACL